MFLNGKLNTNVENEDEEKDDVIHFDDIEEDPP